MAPRPLQPASKRPALDTAEQVRLALGPMSTSLPSLADTPGNGIPARPALSALPPGPRRPIIPPPPLPITPLLYDPTHTRIHISTRTHYPATKRAPASSHTITLSTSTISTSSITTSVYTPYSLTASTSSSTISSSTTASDSTASTPTGKSKYPFSLDSPLAPLIGSPHSGYAGAGAALGGIGLSPQRIGTRDENEDIEKRGEGGAVMPDVQTAGNKVFRDHEVLGLLLGEDTAARLLPGHESSAEMEEDENERIRGRNPVLPNLPIVDAIVHDLGEETSGQIEEREVLDVVPEILHGHSSDRSSDHCSAISDYSAVDRSLPLSGPDTEGPAEKERRERGQIVGTREPVLPDVRIVDAIIHNQTEHLHEYIAQRSALGLDDALLHSDSEKPGNQNPAGGRKQTIDTRAPVLPDLPIADAIVHDQVEHPHEYIVSRSVHDVIDAVLHFPTPLRHDRSALVSRFEHDTGVVDAVMHGDGAKEKPNDHSAVGLGLPGSSVSTSAGGLSPQRIGTRSVCVAKTGLGHVELYKEALFLAVFFSICFIAVRIFMRFLKRDFDQLVYMEPEESGNGRKTADGEMREFGAGNEMSVAERGGAALSDDSCDEEWEEEEQVLIWVGGVIKSVRGTLGRVQRSVEKFDGRAVEGEGVEARV